MPINQAVTLEQAAQKLATWLNHDYSAIKMIEHYLGTASPVDPVIAQIVANANTILQPVFDALSDAETESRLLAHRLHSCRAEFRNLSDYARALPDRLPATGDAHQHAQVKAWLESEIAGAPSSISGTDKP